MTESKSPQLIKALADAIVSNPRATLLDLAELVHVSKATLHRIFGTREALIEALYVESKNTVLEMIRHFNTSDENKDSAFKHLINLHIEHSVMLRFLCANPTMAEDQHFAGYLKTLQQFFLDGQKQRFFKIEYSASVLTEIFISMMFGLIESAGRERIAKAEVARIMELFFLYGSKEV